MNFLAHFHVSPSDPDAITGAFLGDFVRGNVSDHVDLPEVMRFGITLHRQVDAFTDSHPIWQRSAARLDPDRRRLAGIIIDVIYDHFLCRYWVEFSSQELPEFAGNCYNCLLSRTQFMSVEARRVVRRMREYDWLTSYLEKDGISRTFRQLAKRSPALVGIGKAAVDFHQHYEAFENDFLEYYPFLLEFAEQQWITITGPGGADS